MKYKLDYLKPNKRSTMPRYWLFFDTEAHIRRPTPDTQKQSWRLGYAMYVKLNSDMEYESRIERRLYTPDDLLNFILEVLQEENTLHVVAHNIGYDIQVSLILEKLAALGFHYTFLYVKDPTVIAKAHKGKLRISFEDGFNRLRGSIEAWGERLGMPKGKVDFDTVDDEALFEYCKRDVEILAQATLEYLRFIKAHNLGDVKYTISSQALTAFRHRFMKHKIRIHRQDEVIALEREAYGGGMARLIRKGCFTGDMYYQLDVNSMYGYVMRSFDYPSRLLAYKKDADIKYLARFIDKYGIIARCRIKPKTPVFRYKYGKYIIYPLFEFVGVFTTEEIRRLLQEDAILEVYEAAVYKLEPLFVDYVDYFWALRQKAIESGDGVLKELTKQYLNSLYGKFGAKRRSFVETDLFDGKISKPTLYTDLKERKTYSVFWIGDTAYLETIEELTETSIPAIAAHITANARLTLWRFIEMAGYENCYTCDTDGFITNSTGRERVKDYIDRYRLGYLKEEYVSDRLIVLARKSYKIGNKAKIKGVSAIEDKDGEEVFIREEWDSLRKYLKGNKTGEVTVTRKPTKQRFRCYDGIIREDGLVIPWTELPPKLE